MESVATHVVAADGQTQAAAFDASIADERSAISNADATALSTAAHAQLDIVETVEQAFGAADQPD